ncbi:4-hydroxyphenylacetate 3-hydroxylase N-terminal domain-containing protein [Streptomyces sp. NPDC020472]|uniref:4-hydroxyphenylacetate 3-hydroxylase N-terminal domain-containing protein n=1 Tax=Streptomyces sp. NPDC020472 TaxID=3365075 RepID=UPI003787C535
MTRSGQEHPEGPRDGREVRLDGERVEDVTARPAFRATAASSAGLFDLADDPVHRPALVRGGVRRAGAVPRSYEDLVARRRAFRATAEASQGLLGRTPDCTAAGFAASPAAFTGETFDDTEHAVTFSVRLHAPGVTEDRVPDPY